MGVVAEFGTPEALVGAARALREEGVRGLDACTPWPVAELDEALALPPSPVARVVFGAGLLGAATGYLVQWWTAAVDYPLLVGGRPFHAAPAFVLATFETTVLFAGFAALFAAFAFSGLPRPWDPLFDVEGFDRATVDRFFLVVEGGHGGFDPDRIGTLLRGHGPLRVAPFGTPPARG